MTGDEGTGPASVAPDAPETSGAPSSPLTAEERTAAFAATHPAIDRSAALRAGRAPVPRKVVLGMIAALAVIGLGGVVVEHFFGNYGAASSVTTTTLSQTGAPPAPQQPTAPQLSAPLDAFIGLKSIGMAGAPDLEFRDQTGADWSLRSQIGKVVVITFANIGCNDICPVITDELRQAQALLGAKAADVEFAIVNTNPNDTAVVSDPAALSVNGLTGDPAVHFLTGPIRQLNAAWISFGVTVTVGKTPQQLTHNNILYFVDPQDRLRSMALPFANENARGDYVLSQADMTRFAQGIARTAASLTPNP